MHKGPVYELWQEYRTFCGEYPYPLWAPAAWEISHATWAGTAAGLVPGTPLYLLPTGINAALEAVYECDLFDFGGGVRATLQYIVKVSTATHAVGRTGGDWGVNGTLPVSPVYEDDFPWDPHAKAYGTTGTPAEAYLRPTVLEWDARPY